MDEGSGVEDRRLVKLIQRRVDEGVSERAIASRATSEGHKLSHGHVNNLRRGMVSKAPSEEDIRALAAGLAMREADVMRAVFIDWYGYDPMARVGESADPIRDAIDSSTTLSDRDKEILLAQLEVMRERTSPRDQRESSERFA